jgi:hypothetical protein
MRKVLLAGVAALLLATETAPAQVSDNYVPIPRPFQALSSIIRPAAIWNTTVKELDA